MTDAVVSAFSAGQDKDNDGETARAESGKETTPGGREEIRWETVARMPGLTPAQILVGRLRAEGIPARAWQEAGGAIGVTVGLLGIGYVQVPSEYAEQARAILADVEEDDDVLEEDGDE